MFMNSLFQLHSDKRPFSSNFSLSALFRAIGHGVEINQMKTLIFLKADGEFKPTSRRQNCKVLNVSA